MMWRVAADVDWADDKCRRRDRYNPFIDENDLDFFHKYRFSKPAFTELYDIVADYLERHTKRHYALEPTLQLCTALHYYAHGGYLPTVGDVCGLSTRAAGNCIHTVSQAIVDNIERFIKWPDEYEVRQTKADFLEHEKWPSIVGLIDGTHVPIYTPHRPVNESEFLNRKGFHSINVQIVCDRQLKILNLDARFPGSTADADILWNSSVWESFESVEMPDSWLLGDCGYPVKKWLLTPFDKPSTATEEHYNTRHKQILSSVERCNVVLKMRWQCLTKPIMFQPPRASKIIAACGALHNFAIEQGMEIPDVGNFYDENMKLNSSFIDEGVVGGLDDEGLRARLNFVNKYFD